MRIIPDLGRLGLRYLVRDHLDTLYEIDRNDTHRKSRSDYLIFFGLPGILFFAAILFDWRLKGIEELLGGVSILTGLLFGLLIHVFSLGLKVAEDARLSRRDRLSALIEELRANVSYACGVGLLLTAILMVGAGFDLAGPKGLPPFLSGSVCALFMHLVLTLLMVIKRVRTTYKLMVL
ncbi:hypothetical protein [Sphaerisporangium sp. NPDC051011]|uniref:hypothetical protein n=1 Tax=Sphaerisporangium sp. NPDC051011 TaxID=3155792 RepID=UPI0033FA9619